MYTATFHRDGVPTILVHTSFQNPSRRPYTVLGYQTHRPGATKCNTYLGDGGRGSEVGK